MPLVFEQVESLLHHHANKLQNNRHDHWELINAVWAKGKVQQLDNIRFASNRIRQDMIDYLRVEDGRKGSYKYRGKAKTKSIDSGAVQGNGNGKVPQLKNLLVDSYNGEQSVDDRDELEALLATARLSEKDKLILKLRFQKGLTQKEIGKALGYGAANISIRLRRLFDKLRRAAARTNGN